MGLCNSKRGGFKKQKQKTKQAKNPRVEERCERKGKGFQWSQDMTNRKAFGRFGTLETYGHSETFKFSVQEVALQWVVKTVGHNRC